MNPPPGLLPEQRARVKIDEALAASGWIVQDRDQMNLAAGVGVAVREFPLAPGHGEADYLLFVQGKAVCVLEAKKEGFSLSGVEGQAQKYVTGLPKTLKTRVRPLPFMYLSNGAETKFTNLLDPRPRSRRIFQVHRPETLADWLDADTLDQWVKSLHGEGCGFYTAAGDSRPSSLRGRFSTLPPIDVASALGKRFGNQVEAVAKLEKSLQADKPPGRTVVPKTLIFAKDDDHAERIVETKALGRHSG